MKGKCDFMDGSCHESPRWVSLLVAEIYYPDARFPNPVPMPSPTSRFDSPNQFSGQAQPFGPKPEVKKQPVIHQVPAPNMHRNQQVPQIHPGPSSNNNWRSIEDTMSDAAKISPTIGMRRLKRQSGSSGESGEEANDIEKKNPSTEESQCDGVDKIGCYTVRVYYDWFLVPGSCKCWKKTSQGGLDALKKIFIGK